MKRLLQRLWNSPTLMTWGSLAARLSGMVVVLPLVLVKFAPAEVAIWQLFVSLYTLQLLLDFGLAPTFSRLLSYARGGASLEDIADTQRIKGGSTSPSQDAVPVLQQVMSTQRWLYARISMGVTLLFAVGGTLALVAPAQNVAEPSQMWLAWGLVLVSSLIGFWGNGYSAALQGMDQIAITRRWEILFALGQIASAVAVLVLDGSLLTLVAANQTWLVMGAIRNRWLMRRLYPELMLPQPRPNPLVMSGLWPAAWRSGIGVLMSQGIIQASGLIYGQMATPTQLATYMIGLRLITTVSQFSQAPFYSKLPQMAQSYAKGDTPNQLALALRGMRLAHWVFAAGAIGIGVLGAPLLTLIGSNTPFVDNHIWWLLSAAFFTERLGAMYLQLYSTTNHIVWHIANGVTGVLMLGFAWLLFPHLDMAALPLAMLLAYAGFYTVYAIYLSRKAFKFSWLRFEARSAALPLAAAAACVMAQHYFVSGS